MGGVETVPLGAGLLAAGALATAAALRVRGPAAFAAAVIVLGAAEIVLVSIALSALDALRVGWMLLGQAVLSGAAVAWWVAGRRPLPALPRTGSLRRAARAHPAVALLVAAAGLAWLVELVLAVGCTPNNWDAMAYHLARVAYWIQQHSATHFHAGTLRQLSYPPNAELLQAWTFLVSGTDRLANLVQWTALGGLACLVYTGARVLGFARAGAAFAAALFALLPQPVLQATTSQNDLVAAFFYLAAVVLGARGLRDGDRGDLVVAGAALGLGVGAKGTLLFGLLPVALLAGIGVRRLRPPRRLAVTAAAAAVAGVVLLGSWGYALNVGDYGGPLGPANDSVERTSPVPANTARTAWELADLPGLRAGWLDLVLQRTLEPLTGDLRSPRFPGYFVSTSAQEDVAAYGPVGMFLLLPLLVAVVGWRRQPFARRVLAGAALLYLLLFGLLKEWDPWVGRLMLPAVALAAPLFALLERRAWLRTLALVAAFAGLIPSLLTNEQKPLLVPDGRRTVFGLGRLEQQTLIRPAVLPALTALGARIGPTQAIGLVRSGDSWDYSFFGRHLERRVVPLEPREAGQAAIRREGLAGIVFADVPPPPRLRAERLAPGYWLLARR